MTFDEWLKTQPILGDSHIRIAKLAWEAGYQAGGSAEVEWQAYLDRHDD